MLHKGASIGYWQARLARRACLQGDLDSEGQRPERCSLACCCCVCARRATSRSSWTTWTRSGAAFAMSAWHAAPPVHSGGGGKVARACFYLHLHAAACCCARPPAGRRSLPACRACLSASTTACSTRCVRCWGPPGHRGLCRPPADSATHCAESFVSPRAQVKKGGVVKGLVFNWAFKRKRHYMEKGWRHDQVSLTPPPRRSSPAIRARPLDGLTLPARWWWWCCLHDPGVCHQRRAGVQQDQGAAGRARAAHRDGRRAHPRARRGVPQGHHVLPRHPSATTGPGRSHLLALLKRLRAELSLAARARHMP